MSSAGPQAQVRADPYDFVVDLDADTSHASVVRLVGEGRRVLELGPAGGYMSKVLVERGCTVVGIEIDQAMAAKAADFCERVIVGDLDTLDLKRELGEDRFDVILAADVLEHLRDPLETLRRLTDFLLPDGAVVASMPNIAHGSVRLALLQGRFDYQDRGLLDRTHLRFFTLESVIDLFDRAELAIVQLRRQEAPVASTEVRVDLDAVAGELVEALEEDPEARTYQFVVRAVPLHAPGMRELQSRLRAEAFARAEAERAWRNEREREEDERAERTNEELRKHAIAREHAEAHAETYSGRLTELEGALAAISAREGPLRAALVEAHDDVLRRDEQIAELSDRLEREHAELERVAAAHSQLADEATRQRVRLERILRSPPARLYARIGGIPLVARLKRRRTAGYEEALRGARRTGG